MAYKRELIAKTKNLFDSNNIDTQWLGIQYKSVGNGKILLNGAKESGANILPVTRPNITLPAGSYTLSCRMLAGNIEGVEADFNKKIYFGINGNSYTYRCEGVGKVGDYATKTFTLTEDTLLKTFDITAGYTQGFNINNVMIECQLEKGSTATDYVPYGYLTSYKKLLKVSDVCQLLDKREYPETKTINGATFTNNGDGTITVNSLNITANVFVQLCYHYIDAKKGHKYCALSGTNRDGGYFYVDILNENGAWFSEIVDNLYTVPNDNYTLRPTIIAEKNKPFGDKTYKPQLFDLTEMYGAGNEPKTVDEFRAKFPNELYPYSPRCWVKSYKTGLIAKTKNLFDYKTPEYANATLIETLSNGAILKGNLSDNSGDGQYSNGWFRPGSGKNKRIELKTGDIVTISADYTLLEQYSSESNICNIHLYCDIDSLNLTSGVSTVKLPLNKTARISQTYTIKGDADYYPVFTLNSNKVKITNIQIEKGAIATDYVPYGYL